MDLLCRIGLTAFTEIDNGEKTMTMLDPRNLVDATVVAVVTPTLMTVRLSDGRELQAVLSPELRHSRLREEHIPFSTSIGETVRVELSPYSMNKCRILRVVRE